MLTINKLKYILLILLSYSINAQHTDEINSNRPGESQGAFSVGKSVFQVELGLAGIKEKHTVMNTDAAGFNANLNLRWGLFFESLEFWGDIKYQKDQYTTILGTEERAAVKYSTLGAKYMIYDPYKMREEKINLYSWKANHRFKWNKLIPSVAIFAGANLNFTSVYAYKEEPIVSPKVVLIAQNQFDGGYVLVTNIIFDKYNSKYRNLGYIMTLTKGFNEKWSGFFESQGYSGDYYADNIFRVGAAYLVDKSIQIDASITSNIKDTPSILYGGFGLSWRFDRNYKTIRYKKPSQLKKDEAKKAKNKINAKPL